MFASIRLVCTLQAGCGRASSGLISERSNESSELVVNTSLGTAVPFGFDSCSGCSAGAATASGLLRVADVSLSTLTARAQPSLWSFLPWPITVQDSHAHEKTEKHDCDRDGLIDDVVEIDFNGHLCFLYFFLPLIFFSLSICAG